MTLAESDAPVWAALGFSILAGTVTAWWTLRKSKEDRRAAEAAARDAATDRKKANEYADVAAKEAAEATAALNSMTEKLDEANRLRAEAKALTEKQVTLLEAKEAVRYEFETRVTPIDAHSRLFVTIRNTSPEKSLHLRGFGIGTSPTHLFALKTQPTSPFQGEIRAGDLRTFEFKAFVVEQDSRLLEHEASRWKLYVEFGRSSERIPVEAADCAEFVKICRALAQWKKDNPQANNGKNNLGHDLGWDVTGFKYAK